jgi:hypothetical protein
MPRHVDEPLAIRQGLLAILPERDAGVRPDSLQERGNGLCDRPPVPPYVKPTQKIECVGDLGGSGIELRPIDPVHRVETADGERTVAIDPLPIQQKSLVAQRKERTAQRREDLELIVGPFDCREGVSERDDFLAVMERTAADENVGYAARFERPDVRTRNVRAETPETAKEERNMTRPDRNGPAVLSNRPFAVVDQPVDESADRTRQ